MNLERLQLAAVAATAASCTLSIFAAQVCFTVALAVFFARWALGQTTPPRLAVGGFLLAFSVWTLLSASFSSDPVASHESAKKLVLLALIYVAVDSLRSDSSRERIVDALLLGGLVLSAGALFQGFFLGFDTIDRRPTSFLGHYMTASGVEMATLLLASARLALAGTARHLRPPKKDLLRCGLLVAILATLTLLKRLDVFPVEAERLVVALVVAAAAALALSGSSSPSERSRGWWSWLAAGASAIALVLSLTRNAWLGAIAGLALLLFLKAPRTLWLLPAAVVAVIAVGPRPVLERMTLRDDSAKDRYYMWQAAIDMIVDRPVFGQGPGMILKRYPQYRWPEAPNLQTPHLHDNVLQIAAERGVPGAVLWVCIFVAWLRVAWSEWRRFGPARPRWIAGGALAVLSGLFVAGLFEYNFGDSELLMLLLVVAALPYSLRHQREREIVAAETAGPVHLVPAGVA